MNVKSWGWTYLCNSKWIREALKVTADYIPAANVCFILIIKQQKTNSKSLSALDWRTFVALIWNQGSLILRVKTAVLFYFGLFNFSSRLLTEYFKLALNKLKTQFFSFVYVLFYCIILLCYHWHWIPLLFYYWQFSFNNFEDLFFFLLILVTLVFCCGIENRDISLVSKM